LQLWQHTRKYGFGSFWLNRHVHPPPLLPTNRKQTTCLRRTPQKAFSIASIPTRLYQWLKYLLLLKSQMRIQLPDSLSGFFLRALPPSLPLANILILRHVLLQRSIGKICMGLEYLLQKAFPWRRDYFRSNRCYLVHWA